MAQRKTLVEHRCEQCSETFTSPRTRQRFCSYKCNKAWQSAKHWRAGYRPSSEAVCRWCERRYMQRHHDQVYCSEICRNAKSQAKAEARQAAAQQRSLERRRVRAHELAQRREANRPRCRQCGELRSKGKQLCESCRQRNYDIRLAKVKVDVKEWRRRQRRAGRGEAKNHRKRAREYGVPYDPKVTRVKVLDRDNWVCGICHQPIPNILYVATSCEDYGTIDHTIPMSRGGGHTWDNVRAAHNRCNWEEYDRAQGVA